MGNGVSILQIVPRLGAVTDGVADYARTLGGALESSEQTRTAFLCGDPQDILGDGEWRERSAKVLDRSPGALVSALESLASRQGGSATPAVLLHYVNYGYAPRGCPFWLIRGLARWKRRNPQARLVTMFHELYAFGPPWRSSFWLSPIQRHLVREVWKITDGAVTNVGLYRRRLCDWRPSAMQYLCLMPVFSTIGEPAALTKWSGRSAQMVVLGRPEAAARAYGRRREALLRACRALEIRRICDIGARSGAVPSQIENVRVSAYGHLPAADVSAILAESRAGFLDYPTDHLGKSTVFAAYAAHGVVPIVPWRRGGEEPGLAEGANYWAAPQDGSSDFESIANGALAWYTGHRLDVQVREFAGKLRERDTTR